MIRNRIDPDSQTPQNGVGSRIVQFLGTLFSQIRFSQGGVLLGKTIGDGYAEEIEVGSGLEMAGGVLSAKAITSSLTAPTDTALLWLDPADGSLSYHDADSLAWVELSAAAASSASVLPANAILSPSGAAYVSPSGVYYVLPSN